MPLIRLNNFFCECIYLFEFCFCHEHLAIKCLQEEEFFCLQISVKVYVYLQVSYVTYWVTIYSLISEVFFV